LLARVTHKDDTQALKRFNIGVLWSIIVTMKELRVLYSKIAVEISYTMNKKLTDGEHNETEYCEKEEV
jgi:hypothetical protein